MARNLTAGMQTEVAAPLLRPVIFLESEFASGTLRLWTGQGQIDWNGQTWTGGGQLLGISEITETADVRAVGITVSLSGMPASVLSAVLGQARQGLPLTIYVGAMRDVSYLSLPGIAGNFASTPDSAANSVTGDIDIRVDVSSDDWTPLAIDQSLVSKYAFSPQICYLFDVLVAGNLRLYHSADGFTLRVTTSTAVTGFADGSRHWVRVTRSASTGDVKFYTSSDGVTWVQLGATVSTVVEGIFDGTPQVQVGAFLGSGEIFGPGKIYRAQVYNGINGTLVADFDPGRVNPNTLTGQMVTGEVWTVGQSGGTPARIINSGLEIIDTPYRSYQGRLDVPSIEDGGETGIVSIQYENRLIDLERPRARRWTHEDAQIDHPTERGFEYISGLANREVYW